MESLDIAQFLCFTAHVSVTLAFSASTSQRISYSMHKLASRNVDRKIKQTYAPFALIEFFFVRTFEESW